MTILEGVTLIRAREDLEIWRVMCQLAVAPADSSVVLDIMRRNPSGDEISLWNDNPSNRPTFAIGDTKVTVEQDDIDILRLPKDWLLRGVIVSTDTTASGLTVQISTRKWA